MSKKKACSLMDSLVTISKITVKQNRIEAIVCLSDNAPRYTNASLLKAIQKELPCLPDHACKNDKGPTFSAVMNNTSIPHLLEHMTIELQGRMLLENSSIDSVPYDTVLVGTTQWLSDEENVAKVAISFVNDVVALGCLKQALELLNTYLHKEIFT